MCDRLPKRGAAQLEPSVFAPETRSSYGVRRRTQPCVLGAEPNPAVPQTVVSRGPSGAAARRVREDNPEAALALALAPDSSSWLVAFSEYGPLSLLALVELG